MVALEVVPADASNQKVQTATTGQFVSAGSSRQDIVAASTIEAVVASSADEDVVTDTVRLWNPDGSAAGVLRDVGEDVVDLHWSGDGRLLATAAVDSTVRLWDTASHRQLWASVGLKSERFATFSPTGAVLGTASDLPDESLAFVVEHTDGRLETVSASEFRDRFVNSNAGAFNPD